MNTKSWLDRCCGLDSDLWLKKVQRHLAFLVSFTNDLDLEDVHWGEQRCGTRQDQVSRVMFTHHFWKLDGSPVMSGPMVSSMSLWTAHRVINSVHFDLNLDRIRRNMVPWAPARSRHLIQHQLHPASHDRWPIPARSPVRRGGQTLH